MGFIQRMAARSFRLLIVLFVTSFSLRSFAAEDLEATQRLLIAGKYESVIENAQEAIKNKERDEEWRTLLMRAQMALGKYPEALVVATNAVKRYSSSIRMK